MGLHWPWTNRGLDNPLEKLTDDQLSQKKEKWDKFRRCVSNAGLWGFRIGAAALLVTGLSMNLELSLTSYIAGSIMASMGAVFFPAVGILTATERTAEILKLETRHRLKRPSSKVEEYYRAFEGLKIKKEFQAVSLEGLTQDLKVRAPLRVASGPFCTVPST